MSNDKFEATYHGGYRETPAPMPPRPKKTGVPVWAWVGIILGVLFLLCGSIAAIGATTSSEPIDQPVTSVETTRPTEAPQGEVVKAAPVKPSKVAVTPAKFEKVSVRQWKKVSKNPEAYKGKRYVVYGVVTQFDGMTGDDNFRASVDGVNRVDSWEYQVNSILQGTSTLFDDLVTDDEFRAHIEVVGEFEYETMMGGNTAVPWLRVVKIERL